MVVPPPEGPSVLPPDWQACLGLREGCARRLAPDVPWWAASMPSAPAVVLVQEPVPDRAVADVSPGIAGAAAAMAETARAENKPLVLVLTGATVAAGEETTGLAGLRLLRQALADRPPILVTLAPVRGPAALLAADALWWISTPAAAGARLFGPDWADWVDGPAVEPDRAEAGGLSPDSTAATAAGALRQAAAIAGVLTAAAPAKADGPMAAARGVAEDMGEGVGEVAALLDPVAPVPLGQTGALKAEAARLDGRPLILLTTDEATMGGGLDREACHLAARAFGLAEAAGLPVLWDAAGPGFLPTAADGALLTAVARLAPAAARVRTVVIDRATSPTGLSVTLPSALHCRLPPRPHDPPTLRADLSALLFDRVVGQP